LHFKEFNIQESSAKPLQMMHCLQCLSMLKQAVRMLI